MDFSESRVRELHEQFLALKKYADKIHFFDTHFNLIPFEFPAFTSNLDDFFSDAGIEQLVDILKIEQKNLFILDRNFFFEDTKYSFSVRPAINTHNNILNDYAISRLSIHNNEIIEELIYQELRILKSNDQVFNDLLDKTNDMVNLIEHQLKHEYKAGPKMQFMNVFLKGMYDYASAAKPAQFPKKRKFLELYLYAFGFFYGKYLHTLQQLLQTGSYKNLPEIIAPYGFDKKMTVLKEYGFFEAIKNNYGFMSMADLNIKMVEIISALTGELPEPILKKILEPNFLNNIDESGV